MTFLKNMTSLIAVLCVIPAAYAVTARQATMATTAGVSATGAVRRMPTMTSFIYGSNSGSGDSTVGGDIGSSDESLMGESECVNAYDECIKGDDACGSDLTECTTNVLFHGKMAQCASVLNQCSGAGVYTLFGTSDVTALSDVESRNEYNEVSRYTYPTDGSYLGQLIVSASIENMYDTQTCVKRYTSCLQKDSVCGADFELCTDVKSFRKQALLCDSTLARCQSEGVVEMLGTYPWKPSVSTVGGRVKTLIDEGANLAAANAVSTCYKVVEQCFLGACQSNPLRCIEGSSMSALDTAAKTIGAVADGGIGNTYKDLVSKTTTETKDATGTAITITEETYITKSDVNRFLRSSCQDTIGANKYCQMTFLGKVPTKKDLTDLDIQDDVFSDALDQRKKYIEPKILTLMEQFDTKAKNKCTETIKSCAMRSCGEGIGSVCYSSVFGDGDAKTIAKNSTRADIKTACQAIVNTDTYCQYAATKATDAYSYQYNKKDAFDTLFPEYNADEESDPIGVIALLNANLSTSYNAAAIAQMKKQCQAVATGCVKAMCGKDYVNCYRNRTDIFSNLTNSDDASFNASMNKVGGVLDYTVVLGLCMNTVKTANVCDEHMKIEKARLKKEMNSNVANAWGADPNSIMNSWGAAENVRAGWVDAGGAKSLDYGFEIAKTDSNNNKICRNDKGDEGICFSSDEEGDVYDEEVKQTIDAYLTTQSTETLFRELLTDIEYEAQAKYNAKLTKQQNMCLSSNNGGILGVNDTGSTFMWVKLTSDKVPSTYAGAGLKESQFRASNDLYGSFCRVRVTLGSDDINIQNAITNGADWATTHFAAGDAFTCGSWISKEKLQELAKLAGTDARETAEASQPKIKGWVTALSAIGLGAGGTFLGAKLGGEDGFSGLSSNKNKKKKNDDDFEKNQKQCKNYVDAAIRAAKTPDTWATAHTYAESAVKAAKKIDVETSMNMVWGDLVPATKEGLDPCECVSESDSYGCNGKQTGRGICKDEFDKTSSSVIKGLNELKSLCEDATDDSDNDNGGLTKGEKIGAGVGAGVGAIAGGLLGYYITDSIMDAQLDKAEQEAIKEFMDSVGSKIKCYIGGEEVGNYGQVISTSME